MPLGVGLTFADYTIVRPLGAGAMGDVYLAQHPRLPRRDALKLLSSNISADHSFRERFLREADLTSTLSHPNIVRVNDRGDYHGQLWIAMDFIDGADAGRLLDQRYPTGMPKDLVAVGGSDNHARSGEANNLGDTRRCCTSVLSAYEPTSARLASRPQRSGHTARTAVLERPGGRCVGDASR